MTRGKRDYKSKHHIIPKARGGNNSLENIAMVDNKSHEAYHIIFRDKTPEEIVEHLVKKYWGNNWGFVEEAYRRNDV